VDQSNLGNQKLRKKDQYLGTSRAIKLPFVIGTKEYIKHPYAGVVYIGEDELE
jgi:hypothetical protein